MQLWSLRKYKKEINSNINQISNNVCVCIIFHRGGFFQLQDFFDILEGTDQRYYVVSIIPGASAKFRHLHFKICHISPPEDETPARRKLE